MHLQSFSFAAKQVKWIHNSLLFLTEQTDIPNDIQYGYVTVKTNQLNSDK